MLLPWPHDWRARFPAVAIEDVLSRLIADPLPSAPLRAHAVEMRAKYAPLGLVWFV